MVRVQIPFRPEKFTISKCMANHSKIDLKNLGPCFATALVPYFSTTARITNIRKEVKKLTVTSFMRLPSSESSHLTQMHGVW